MVIDDLTWEAPFDLLSDSQAPSLTTVGHFEFASDRPDSETWPILTEAVTVALARGIDPGALFFSMMAAASAAIPNSIRLQVDPAHPDWFEYPCIWVMLIGNPSVGKSLHHRLATAPLHDKDIELDKESSEAWKAYQAVPAKRRDPVPPPERRLMLDDVTAPKLVNLLGDNPHRLMISSEEAASLIGAHSEKRGVLNKAFSGELQAIDRKTQRSIRVRDACLSMLLSTHPDILRGVAIDAQHDGFWQRFIPVEVAPSTTPIGEHAELMTLSYQCIIENLLELDDSSYRLIEKHADSERNNTLKFSTKAQSKFNEYRESLKSAKEFQDLEPNLVNHILKLDRILCRIALIIHVSKHSHLGIFIPQFIDDATLDMSYRLIKLYIIPQIIAMHDKYFEGFIDPDVKSAAMEILTRRKSSFWPSELKSIKKTDTAIRGLTYAGWIKLAKANSKRYLVNPRIFSELLPDKQARVDRQKIAQQAFRRLAD